MTLWQEVLSHLRAQPSGYVFSMKDLVSLGGQWQLRCALLALVEGGYVRPLGRGYYDLPGFSELLQRHVAVDPYQLLKAITRREGIVFLPPDVVYANAFGLTNANSVRREMQVAGRTRMLNIGNVNYKLHHMPARDWKHATSSYGPAYQALRWLGKDVLRNQEVKEKFRCQVPAEMLVDMRENAGELPAWMRGAISEIFRNVS